MKSRFAYTAVALAFTASVNAQTQYGIGLGVMSGEDGYIGVDDDVDVVPLISIDSRNFYFFATQFGYKVGNVSDLEFTALADYRTDGFEAADSTAFTGMDDRSGTLELGLEMEYSTDLGDFTLAVMADALDEHGGSELSASYSLPIILRSSQIVPFITVTQQSADLVDYYYGVRATEATGDRAAYEADSTINYEVGVQARWQSGEHHQILTSISHESWGDEITDSPLIDSDGGLQAVVGYVYVF